jgi:hypothetical protein
MQELSSILDNGVNLNQFEQEMGVTTSSCFGDF